MKRLNPFLGYRAMEIIAVVGLGVVAAFLSVVLRQYKSEYSLFVSLMAGILLLTFLMENIAPLLEEMGELLRSAGLEEDYLEILLKSLGVCFLVQLSSDACRDAGESAIAAKIEAAGKMAVLLLSLPLFTQILSVAGSLFSI